MKITENDIMAVAHYADAIINKQNEYIEELEKKIDDLQKALDIALQNKCRIRKVRVKYVGRSQMDKNSYRCVR